MATNRTIPPRLIRHGITSLQTLVQQQEMSAPGAVSDHWANCAYGLALALERCDAAMIAQDELDAELDAIEAGDAKRNPDGSISHLPYPRYVA